MQWRPCKGGNRPRTTRTLSLSEMVLSVIILTAKCLTGFVFKAVESATGIPVAIKRSQKVGNKVSREFEVLSELRGKPNVIQLVDFFYSLDTKERLI